ncbi:MAG: cytochrome c oxidase accessory protein CcoG [Flavobacteriales bacterium]|nr:cytochrome c oxidase accessory protein CcoG [Flavobacteriales bacterium]NNK81143.1 cytochrome c oxidase accessory protein CcoG [Flavobacteriales bacterium]
MEDQESYRDSIATVDEKGKRIWIYPKKPSGWYYDKRKLLSYFFLTFLFVGPYIKVGSEPLLMANILERKFVFFGQVFWPQDFYIFALGMITFVVFIILFTVVFGRLFCGWVCPQTIFMEMVFRRIEYWIEGDYKHQKKLNNGPWDKVKVRKKVLKHTIFWIISFLIANTFLSYVIGYEALWEIILDNPLNHLGGLISIVIFTTVFYLVFSQMREQVCIAVCPYGRLQGVLLDRKSLVVAYDYVRGEGRAKFRKNEDRTAEGKGDCIDCHQCVDVCPTGIDIRNGTQLECVNCTACMDACDFMMNSVGLEPKLIRYDSEEGIKNKVPFGWTNRKRAYSGLLVILIGILSTLLLTRSDFEAKMLRTRGTTFQEMQDNKYGNLYDLYILNKTNKDMELDIALLEGDGEVRLIGAEPMLEKQGDVTQKIMILIDKDKIGVRSTPITIGVYGDGELIKTIETNFLGPRL